MMPWVSRNGLLRPLRVGQYVWATVEEVIDAKTAIVGLGGDLLRVVNQSGTSLVLKQRVQLRVTASAPLEFQIANSGARRELGHFKIDIEV